MTTTRSRTSELVLAASLGAAAALLLKTQFFAQKNSNNNNKSQQATNQTAQQSTSSATRPNNNSNGPESESKARRQALAAREASRKLQALSTRQRRAILEKIATRLLEKQAEILEANARDLSEAQNNAKLSGAMVSRLKLTRAKLETLAAGIRQIASGPEPMGKVLVRRELAQDLILQQETAPIGVLLVIFESRPDCLPQISALAIASGNGLLLKGGSEARHSNRFLHRLISQTVGETIPGGEALIALVESRSEVKEILALDDCVDLVIPRGSGQLVSYIEDHTKIPVLGHSEGLCHVFVDQDAELDKAVRVVVDSKCDYPAACNAVECLLLHQNLFDDSRAENRGFVGRIVAALVQRGVRLFCGPALRALLDANDDNECVRREFSACSDDDLELCASFKTEYGDMALTIEVVPDLTSAIAHIHAWGSGHTDCIVTENRQTSESFLKSVDSACVFHNASTRFADGFRFGLGAEVGISTKKIHARGPVGVMGLETTRWKLKSRATDGHTAHDFAAAASSSNDSSLQPRRQYTHAHLQTDGNELFEFY